MFYSYQTFNWSQIKQKGFSLLINNQQELAFNLFWSTDYCKMQFWLLSILSHLWELLATVTGLWNYFTTSAKRINPCYYLYLYTGHGIQIATFPRPTLHTFKNGRFTYKAFTSGHTLWLSLSGQRYLFL